MPSDIVKASLEAVTPALSPKQIAMQAIQLRIDTARDVVVKTLEPLHPDERLEVARAVLRAVEIASDRVIKRQQLEKLKQELGEI